MATLSAAQKLSLAHRLMPPRRLAAAPGAQFYDADRNFTYLRALARWPGTPLPRLSLPSVRPPAPFVRSFVRSHHVYDGLPFTLEVWRERGKREREREWEVEREFEDGKRGALSIGH